MLSRGSDCKLNVLSTRLWLKEEYFRYNYIVLKYRLNTPRINYDGFCALKRICYYYDADFTGAGMSW